MGPLLAPVDLDMSYTRATYFDNTSGGVAPCPWPQRLSACSGGRCVWLHDHEWPMRNMCFAGKHSDEDFTTCLKNERVAMRENLGGSTASTGLADMDVRAGSWAVGGTVVCPRLTCSTPPAVDRVARG